MKKLAYFLLSAILGLSITGCATNNNELKELRIKAAMVANENANKPLFHIDCPTTGCSFNSLTVNNPNPKTLDIPREINGWDFANRVLGVATTVTPWIILGDVAKTGIRNAGSSFNDSYNTSNTSNSDSSVHDSYGQEHSSVVDSSTESVSSSTNEFSDSSSTTTTDTSSVSTNTSSSTTSSDSNTTMDNTNNSTINRQ